MKEGIQPERIWGQEMAPLICFSYVLAPPGVYFEKVPFPFSADKMGRRLQLVSRRAA